MPTDPDPRFRSVETTISYVRSFLPSDDGGGADGALESVGGPFGHYEGLPTEVAWLPDGRMMKLLKAIAYHRQDGGHWPVPAGIDLDGASIPRALWTLIGGPFEGKYRDASIVHDYYCVTKDRPWQDVHRMFHDAMHCSGVGKAKATVMFYAVYRFGPRWPVPGLESVESPLPVEPLDTAAAESFARDAEAILEHGLGPREVEALAEARASAASHALKGLENLSRGGRAAQLVVAGGTGDANDVAAVAARAGALPDFVIDHFLAKRIRIVACRDSVTDFETSLRGVIPRGWESIGRTWDSVPGSYFGERKRVVIATVVTGGTRTIPDKSSRLHGSDDLVVHESLHGYDYSRKHVDLSLSAFRDARDSDKAGLTDYEKQEGRAGLEETFAETGAQFCSNRQALEQRCPSLAGFWNNMPIATGAPLVVPQPSTGPVPLGTATRATGGRLYLDLRAEGEGGAIGHALLTIDPGEPQHAALEHRLFSGRGGLESTVDETVPFFP